MNKLLTLTLALASAVGAQTIRSGGADTWTSGAIISGASSSGLIVATGTAIVESRSSWLPVESRKLDQKGPTLAQVRQAAMKLDRTHIAPASYIKLAKEVGVTADEPVLVQVLYDQGFKIYDYNRVDNYLYRQALKQGANAHWVWEPVRESDLKAAESIGWRSTNVGFIYPKVYGQQIPIRILSEMKAILDVMPEAVFMISHYEVIKPDPFLAVTTKDLLGNEKIWIIDQWDEPGWGEEADSNEQLARR